MNWRERIEKNIAIVITAVFALVIGIAGISMIPDNRQEIKELKRIDYDCEYQDPTYYEMKDFLAFDRTNLNVGGRYVWSWYTCIDSANDVKRNALEKGIRCTGVIIRFGNAENDHAVVAFQTTDKGVIFIEPQTDEEVEVVVGMRYFKDNDLKDWVADDFDDTITEIEIYWPK